VPDSQKAVKIIVGVFVAGIMAAFLLPVAIGGITGPEELTATQDVGETITLQDDLNATLDGATAGGDAKYTLTTNSSSVTQNVTQGTNETVTIDGIDVTITADTVNSGNATTTYEFPTTYGWGSGTASLWAILPVLLVLAVFLYLTGRAVDQF